MRSRGSDEASTAPTQIRTRTREEGRRSPGYKLRFQCQFRGPNAARGVPLRTLTPVYEGEMHRCQGTVHLPALSQLSRPHPHAPSGRGSPEGSVRRGSEIPMELVSTSASPRDSICSMRMLLLLSITRGTKTATSERHGARGQGGGEHSLKVGAYSLGPHSLIVRSFLWSMSVPTPPLPAKVPCVQSRGPRPQCVQGNAGRKDGPHEPTSKEQNTEGFLTGNWETPSKGQDAYLSRACLR